MQWYSEIPLLRPPKIKTFYQLKTLFGNLKLFFSSFSTISVHLIRDHLWDCPKVVFKTTFGQSQWWSYYRNFTVICQYVIIVLNDFNQLTSSGTTGAPSMALACLPPTPTFS